MSEIKLFEVGTVVKERTSSTVVLEKQLQTTIEQNMETFFGVRFLKSEYMITSGRMDSIGIDENNSPVIFEYKRSSSENVINQGLFYLDWLLCIFRKNCASVPEERSAIPLQTEQSSAG